MSVDISAHLMYGIRIEADQMDQLGFDEVHEDFEDEMCGTANRRFDMVYDNMCGDYVCVGVILGTLSRGASDGFKTFDPNMFVAKLDLELVDKINTALNSSFTVKDFKILFFNHYS